MGLVGKKAKQGNLYRLGETGTTEIPGCAWSGFLRSVESLKKAVHEYKNE